MQTLVLPPSLQAALNNTKAPIETAQERTLRPYQNSLKRAIYSEFRKGSRSVLLVASGGLGKTTLAAWIFMGDRSVYAKRPARSIFLVERNCLIDQTQKTLLDLGVECSIIQGDRRIDWSHQCMVASLQTLRSWVESGRDLRQELGDVGMFVLDEAHDGVGQSIYQQLVERLAPVLNQQSSVRILMNYQIPFADLNIGDRPKKDDVIAVWVSCGAASAVAAIKTLEIYGDTCSVRFLNNPIAEEHCDNRRFLVDLEKYLGQSIEIVSRSKYPNSSIVEVFDDRKYISNRYGAPCTSELKIKARQEWEKTNHSDWIVLGFTVEENRRIANFKLSERSNLLPVLSDCQFSKKDCFEFLEMNGLQIPEIYSLGFSNANCIGCVKSSSVNYWKNVRDKFPEIYAARATQSRRLNCKLLKHRGNRYFLDEIDNLRIHLKNTEEIVDCSVFCREEDVA